MFTKQLTLGWKILKRAFIVFAGLLLFVVFIEIIRALQTLSAIHPILAWVVGGIGVGSVLWGVWKIYCLLNEFPSAPTAPDPAKYENKENTQYLKAQLQYLKTVVKGLKTNNHISAEYKKTLTKYYTAGKYFDSSGDITSLKTKINTIDSEIIKPVLSELDNQAEIIVRNTVRDTMVGVMLLPFKAADIYLVIYRNGAMFFDLVKLYNQRPGTVQTYHVFRDVVKIVATVNILNYAERFTQRVMASVPFLDKTIDDIMQGTGAGVLTTAVGKATIQRCRTYSSWNTEEQIDNYRKTTVDFLVYVKEILTQDVLPNMSKPWKIAWGHLKGYFEKSEANEVGLEKTNKKQNWKEKVTFWKKNNDNGNETQR